MGYPIDLDVPIFFAERICDFPRYKGYRVVVGREEGCSYYTNVAIIESTDRGLGDHGELQKLRDQLRDFLCNQGGPAGQGE
jgi:hypothetical protein